MRFEAAGYRGVQSRMKDLQRKLDDFSGIRRGTSNAAPSIADSGQPPIPGAITPNGVSNGGGFEPMSPFGGAAKIGVEGAPPAIKAMIQDAANSAGIDMVLFEALVGQESNYNPSVTSPKGALGLSQLMPGTAQALGVDPRDPLQNLQGGARYFAQMLRQFQGDTEKALAAYNAGPGAVTRYNGIPPFRETQDYVRKVLARYNSLRQP